MHATRRIRTLAQTALVTAALTAGMIAAPRTFVQSSQIDNPDWPLRSSDIHWPAGHTPADADLFAHNELLIDTSCSIVWQHLVEAKTWPEWYPNSHNVKLLNSPDGRLHHDTQFSWDTFGVHIDSRVHEFAVGRRLGWFGRGTGMDAYHTFLLVKAPAGCRVVTEEVVRGTGAVEFRKNDPNAMHRGHDLWLSSLKDVSEKGQTSLPKKISAESGTAHKEKLSQSTGDMKPKLLIPEKDEGKHCVRQPRELPVTNRSSEQIQSRT